MNLLKSILTSVIVTIALILAVLAVLGVLILMYRFTQMLGSQFGSVGTLISILLIGAWSVFVILTSEFYFED